MMQIFISFFFLVGLSSSAILDSKEFKTKSNWDDDDSMTLPTTLPSYHSAALTQIAKEQNVEKDENNEETQTKFISLIPKENVDTSNYEYQSDQSTPDTEEFSTSANPSTEENSDSESSTEAASDTRVLPKTHLMQLGKIPLKLKVIPLMAPEHGQLLSGKQDEPVTYKEDLSEGTTIEKLGQNQRKSGEEVSDDVIRVRDLENKVPPSIPLTYLVPPRRDAEDAWKQLPETGVNNFHESFPVEENSIPSHITPTTSIYPILERLNDFLQKAKRHSLEQQADQTNAHNAASDSGEEIGEASAKEMDDSKQHFVQDDSEELTSAMMSRTTETIEKMDDFTQSSPTADFSPEYPDQSLINIPRPAVHDFGYQRGSEPLPYHRPSIMPPSPVANDYVNYNIYNGQRPNSVMYSNPSMSVMSPAINQLRGEIYAPRNLYWLRRYMYPNILNENDDSVQSSYLSNYFDDYYRPQRSNYILPSSAIMNEIQQQRESSFVPSAFPYTNRLYGNLLPRRNNLDLDQLYYSPSYQRPLNPYRSYYSYPMLNELMYAPTYSYQKYNSLIPSAQTEYF